VGGISAIFIPNDGKPLLYFAPRLPIGLNPAEKDNFPVYMPDRLPGKEVHLHSNIFFWSTCKILISTGLLFGSE